MQIEKDTIDNELSIFFEKVPKLDLSYINTLTNRTGIIQHAKFNIPNYHHGYCLDDNCRALLLILTGENLIESKTRDCLATTYLSFILYSQLENGYFRNFMSYDLKFLEKKGSDDSVGRTIWTLGYLLSKNGFKKFHPITKEIFDKAINQIDTCKSARASAYLILGLLYYLEKFPSNSHILILLQKQCLFLQEEYKSCHEEQWKWFEEIMSYDNAIIPMAILKASRFLKNKELEEIGLESSFFLNEILFRNGNLSTIGNTNWYKKHQTISDYAQQPIEVSSIIAWYLELQHHHTGINIRQNIKLAFLWFLGWNGKNESLFDYTNMACYDGLEVFGVNKNQGAESNISFWISYCYVLDEYQKQMKEYE